MELDITTTHGIVMAELRSEQVEMKDVDTALDLIGNCGYLGAHCLIVQERHITPAFFDLKTKVAGDILQKFSTYGIMLAIVGDFSSYASKSLQDFIRESNQVGKIIFVSTLDAAKEKFLNHL